MSKKILIVTECFYPEEFKINDIALSWKEKGYDVDVLTLTPTYPLGRVFNKYKNKFLYKDCYKGINIYRVWAVTGYNDSLFRKLLKYINFMIIGSAVSLAIGKRYNYIFGFNTGALTSMFPAVLASKVYRVPLTLWVQDVWPDSVYAYGFKKNKMLSFFLERLVKKVYCSANSIAISSKGFEQKIRPYVKREMTLHYLPNWPDYLDMSIDAYKFNDNSRLNFTFAGNIGKIQNLENIITAFSSLPGKYLEKSQLNIIGDGSDLKRLKTINNCKNIIFHGKKPRDDMGKYYKGSDFLIVSLIDKPIFSLTVPAKTQTYIAAKKPILAIINGETAHIVDRYNLGYCAKPNDVSEIYEIFIKSIDLDNHKLMVFSESSDFLLTNVFNKKKIINSLEGILIN